MIFGTYKLYIKQQVAIRYQFYLNARVRRYRRRHEWTICTRTVCHRTLRKTRVPATDICSQQPGFKCGGLRHLGPCRSESITA